MLPAAKPILKALVPPSVMRFYQARSAMALAAAQQAGAPDITLLSELCPRGCVAVDVGSNIGVFTANLRQLASRVHAFEPNGDLADALEIAFRFDRRVTVHREALSDRSGITWLRIPVHNGKIVTGLATMEPENALSGLPTKQVLVSLSRLDDMQLGLIGFIKIDVEGHELAVLHGARETLANSRPNVLVEAADWHRPDAARSVIQVMTELGYDGWFLWGDQLVPGERFDPRVHQCDDAHDELGRRVGEADYAGNFVFRPQVIGGVAR